MFTAIFIAFIQPFASAFCDVFHSRLTNGIFKSRLAQLLYTKALTIITLPILLIIFGRPDAIDFVYIGLMLLAIALDIAIMMLFLRALRFIDASISQAFWNLGAASIPFVGAIVFNESLSMAAVAGFLIIVASSIALETDEVGKVKFGQGFWLMMGVAAIYSTWVLLNATIVRDIGWFNTVFYYQALLLLLSGISFTTPYGGRLARENWDGFRRNIGLFMVYGFVATASFFSGIFALGALPLIIKEGISSVQPLFVLFFAWAFSKFGFGGAKEDLRGWAVIKKIACFILMCAGLVMLVR
ncbi:MAG: hypothetical protein FWD15_00785 [Alphaproteobacteria bacterium]|nr:hypothetical protein [Alphaproteobacteria bacterium]